MASLRIPRLYLFEYVVAIYCLIGLTVSRRYGFAIPWHLSLEFRDNLMLVSIGGVCLLLVFLFREIVVEGRRVPRIIRRLTCIARMTVCRRGWWIFLIRAMIAVDFCLLTYSSLKQQIPILNPALFDAQLSAIDMCVHGCSPATVLPAKLSNPILDRCIDGLYVLWYALKAPVLMFFLFQANGRRAERFFTGYVLMWILGGTSAILIPSLGPVFVDSASFKEINSPIAHHLQGRLWSHYREMASNPQDYKMLMYEGIAAFPSLHVGIAAFFAISFYGNRRSFWALAVYALVIQYSSVFLGWHYAIDGYVATILAAFAFIGTLIISERCSVPAVSWPTMRLGPSKMSSAAFWNVPRLRRRACKPFGHPPELS